MITFATAFGYKNSSVNRSLIRLHKQLVVQEACTKRDLQQWSNLTYMGKKQTVNKLLLINLGPEQN